MMRSKVFSGLAICVLILSFSPAALAQSPQPFSADFSTVSTDGRVAAKGKFHFSAPRIRMDMAEAGGRQAGGAGKMSMIVDGDKKASYMLMPEQQMYMEFLASDNNPARQRMPRVEDYRADPCSSREFASCKKLGTETVNGRACDKWEAVEKNGDKHTMWVDQKLHFPIKSQTGGMTTEFTNIKEGTQDAALFTIPPGYRKFDAGAFGRPPR
jgi:outer membrane lipoprotein-sorting protein